MVWVYVLCVGAAAAPKLARRLVSDLHPACGNPQHRRLLLTTLRLPGLKTVDYLRPACLHWHRGRA